MNRQKFHGLSLIKRDVGGAPRVVLFTDRSTFRNPEAHNVFQLNPPSDDVQKDIVSLKRLWKQKTTVPWHTRAPGLGWFMDIPNHL